MCNLCRRLNLTPSLACRHVVQNHVWWKEEVGSGLTGAYARDSFRRHLVSSVNSEVRERPSVSGPPFLLSIHPWMMRMNKIKWDGVEFVHVRSAHVAFRTVAISCCQTNKPSPPALPTD